MTAVNLLWNVARSLISNAAMVLVPTSVDRRVDLVTAGRSVATLMSAKATPALKNPQNRHAEIRVKPVPVAHRAAKTLNA